MTPCEIWAGATFANGYGMVAVDGKVRLAHRVAWERHVQVGASGRSHNGGYYDDLQEAAAQAEALRNLLHGPKVSI